MEFLGASARVPHNGSYVELEAREHTKRALEFNINARVSRISQFNINKWMWDMRLRGINFLQFQIIILEIIIIQGIIITDMRGG